MAHGFTAQGGLGAGGSFILHESSAHSVLVPDTELLFTAQFHRAGPDLVLTGRDGAHHLVPGYFSSEHHPALVAPNGAHLSPETVDLLAGSAMPGHYAQAQPTAPADSIGKIEKVVGDVTVVRNGVAVALHVGDAVFKSDVVATGSSSSCGISFPDGTALNLVANTRMALNDYAFDANSNANGALFTLVEGTFAFVAGKVAHQGDMKIATPVATMGIRGTTGVVQEQPNAPATITATAADHTYSFAVVPDIGTGITGMWDVYLTDANGIIQRDANGNPIVLATVSQSGYVTYLTPQGLGQPPLVTTEPATNSQYAFEQEMLEQLFRTLNPSNLNNNNNGGSSTTPPPFQLPNPIPQLFEDSGKPFAINVPNGANPAAPATPTIIDIVVGPTGPLTVVIWIANGNGLWGSGPSWLGASTPSSPQEVVIPDYKVTTDGADSAAGLVVEINPSNPDNPGILNIVSGTSFTIYDFIHGDGTVQLNASGSDPTLFIHGAVPLVGGGTIKMVGTAGQDFILGVPGTGALLLNIDYTIEGTGTIGGGDGNLTFENFGTVNANDGLLTINTGNAVANNGLMEATLGGTLAIDDGVSNVGTIKADGAGSAVTFVSAAVTNLAGGTINATSAGTVTFDHGSLANAGTLEATNGGILQLEHLTVTNSAAGELSIDALSELDLMSAKVIGGTSTNAGNVVVTDGASVLHGDSVTNSGTMTVEGAGASLTLEGNTTLLNDTGGHITATEGGLVTIELDTNGNVNSGTIQAFCGGEVDFSINIDGGSNYGLIEAGAGGTVHFFDNHGGGGGGGGQGGNHGTMEATDGGHLIFDGGLDNFYLVEALNGGTIDLKNGIKNHAGTVDAAGSGSQISISGGDQSENADQILAEHHGVISLASVVLQNDAGATIAAASGGSISWITGGIDNFGIFSAGNNGTITFGGDIGITNKIGGTFEAALGGSIVFGASDTGSVNNDGGTIVATDGGTITFDSTLNGAENIDGGIIKAGTGGTIVIDGFQHGNGLFNGGGLIEANGTGAAVNLFGATIIGGTLETSAGGVIVAATGTSIFLNVTATDGTVIQVDDGAILNLLGGLGGVSHPALTIDGTVTLQGGTDNTGIVEIDVPSYFIAAGAGGGTLENETTIEGAGVIGTGDGTLVLNNETDGTIVANLSTGIIIYTGSTVTNDGLLKAINGASLTIESAVDNTTTGTMLADGYGSYLFATDGLTNQGLIEACNAGTVVLGSESGISNLAGGTIEAIGAISGPFSEVVISAAAGADQSSIDNAGQILALKHGYVSLTGNIEPIDNYGTIKADDGRIVIETTATLGNSDNLTNHDGGVIEALNGGVVTIGAAGVVFNLGGGHLKADGGTLALNATGGVTNDAGATIEAADGGILQFTTLTPTLDNAGTIKLNDGTLVVVGSVILPGGGNLTLDGGGTVTLGDDSGNAIKSGGAAATFTNVDNTISGAGTIGDACLTLINEHLGVIDADDSHALILNTGANAVTNYGTLEANAGTLIVESCVVGCGDAIITGGGTADFQGTFNQDVNFCGANAGTLELAHAYCGTLYGFGADDAVELTNIAYSSGEHACWSQETGVLSIYDGAKLQETIKLDGTYDQTDFTVVDAAGNTEIVGVPAGTSSADNYVWVGPVSGSWDVAGNWQDTTAGQNPAHVVPGINDNVTINAAGGDALQVITGVGNSASLTINGATDLSGYFTTGNLLVDDGGSLEVDNALTVTGNAAWGENGVTSQLTVDGGTLTVDGSLFISSDYSQFTLNAGAVTVEGFELGVFGSEDNFTINGGTLTTASLLAYYHNTFTVYTGGTLSVAGDVNNTNVDDYYHIVGGTFTVQGTFTSSDSAIQAEGGGQVQLAGLAIASDLETTNGVTLIADESSSIEIGTAGGAAAGSITVDSGVTTTVSGSFNALNIINNGTIDVVAGGTLTLDGSLDGSGAINIGSGASLVVENGGGQAAAATAPTITFEGTGDTLTIYGSALNASHDFVPTISGLNASDVIDYEGAVTSARYDSDDGVLTLFNGANAVAFLTIGSGYGGDTFNTTAIDGGSVTQIVDPPAVTATIANGGTLVVNTSSSEIIDFTGGTGTLVLNQSQSFSGQIVGFTGTAPDATHSDAIDLTGINYDSSHFSETYNASTDILTVTDGAHTAYLAFDDFQGTFEFASDGKGGTIIFDPPTTGATDASAPATTAPGNDHVAASTHQNAPDPAASPANEAGFGSDQDSAAAATAPGGAAAPPANQLALAGNTITAPPSATSALGGSDLAAFGDDHVAAPTAGPAAGGVHSGAATITNVASPDVIALVAPGTSELDREHLADWTIADGSSAAHGDAVTPTIPTVPTAPANEHAVAPSTVTALAPASSPTLASASLGGLGNDSFAFHPTLGSDTPNTDTHASELAHGAVQIGSPALASIVPEFHQEFAFAAIHQDAANLAAAVDQFHQMAANSTLLH